MRSQASKHVFESRARAGCRVATLVSLTGKLVLFHLYSESYIPLVSQVTLLIYLYFMSADFFSWAFKDVQDLPLLANPFPIPTASSGYHPVFFFFLQHFILARLFDKRFYFTISIHSHSSTQCCLTPGPTISLQLLVSRSSIKSVLLDPPFLPKLYFSILSCSI